MSRRQASHPQGARAQPATSGVLVFAHDRKRGAGVAVGTSLRAYRYAIARHPRGGWTARVFAVARPGTLAGAVEELLAAADVKTRGDAEAWCNRDFLLNR